MLHSPDAANSIRRRFFNLTSLLAAPSLKRPFEETLIVGQWTLNRIITQRTFSPHLHPHPHLRPDSLSFLLKKLAA